VVDSISGEPVCRATVVILSTKNDHVLQAVSTDEDGRFAMEGLPAAKYQLIASKRGYRTAPYEQHDRYTSAIVTGEGQDTEKVNFRLDPEATLRIEVTDDNGDPVDKARIMVFRRNLGDGFGDRVEEIDQVTAVEDGLLEYTTVPIGQYYVAVAAKPWYAMHSAALPGHKANPALDVAYPVTFFGDTTDEAAATLIQLAAGSHEHVAIHLHAVPALHLRVPFPKSQQDRISMPKLQRTVFGSKLKDEEALFPENAENGMEEFVGVAPGSYELSQDDPPRILALNATGDQEISANTGTLAVAVEGTIRNASGVVLPTDLELVLHWTDWAHPREPLRSAIGDGRFAFSAVLPGAWEMWAESRGKKLSVISNAVNGTTHPNSLLTVADHPLSVAVTYVSGETRVEGFALKDGKGLAGAMVVLVPRNPGVNTVLFRRDQSDSDGSFALVDAAPGQYTVVAIEDGWDLDWAKPEVIGRYLALGIGVTIGTHAEKMIHLSQPIPVQAR
jgi:uncharacterized surface anchored protein